MINYIFYCISQVGDFDLGGIILAAFFESTVIIIFSITSSRII